MRSLGQKQSSIERRLFPRRLGASTPSLFLSYGVTSSYVEGPRNALAAFGHSRDTRQGKLQLLIGLLSDLEGTPVAVRLFEESTCDRKTVAEQVRNLAKRLGVSEATLVGDRGMPEEPQLELFRETAFLYTTANANPEIRSLLCAGVLYMRLFDQSSGEVEHQRIRYVLRRNPRRARQVARSRRENPLTSQSSAGKRRHYLCEPPRVKVEVAACKVPRKTQAVKKKGLA